MENYMIEISLRDSCFSHHPEGIGLGSTKLNKIKFDRDPNKHLDICFFTDGNIKNNDVLKSKSKINIAWILEPVSINMESYEKAYQNIDRYDYILTHNLKLINANKNKCFYYPFGGCWIKDEDRKIHEKTNNFSIIASEKNWTMGHRLRHLIINNYKNKIDLVCGRGYKPIDYKLNALKDYRYSFIIENDNNDIYFSEKLIDAFMTGTIPIFWGSNIKSIFDSEGILFINEFNQIEEYLEYGKDFYESKKQNIINNFNIAKQFTSPEDWIYDNFLNNILIK
jgi:hypothetical protein